MTKDRVSFLISEIKEILDTTYTDIGKLNYDLIVELLNEVETIVKDDYDSFL